MYKILKGKSNIIHKQSKCTNTNDWTNKRMNEFINISKEGMNIQMNEWMSKWMNEWMAEWMNEWHEWMDEWVNECC